MVLEFVGVTLFYWVYFLVITLFVLVSLSEQKQLIPFSFLSFFLVFLLHIPLETVILFSLKTNV